MKTIRVGGGEVWGWRDKKGNERKKQKKEKQKREGVVLDEVSKCIVLAR